MNGFGGDYMYVNGPTAMKNYYPDWVRVEKFYNCENFSQTFFHRSSLVKWLCALFGRQ